MLTDKLALGKKPFKAKMNFRPQLPSQSAAHNLEPEEDRLSEIIYSNAIKVCKKIALFDTNLVIYIYVNCLFLVSLVGDILPIPKTYFSNPDNVLNSYFVKAAWAWTLVLVVPFVAMTAFIFCGMNPRKVLKYHLPRLFVASMFWFFWTTSFAWAESKYGSCSNNYFSTKQECLRAQGVWQGFDISGHAFILIYSTLLLKEEARIFSKWESLKHYIIIELYNRHYEVPARWNILRFLTNEQLHSLNHMYVRFSPMVKVLFVGMAALQVLWNIMLMGTILYFHKIVEKIIGGGLAMLTWYFTYCLWFKSGYSPKSPANGFLFKNHKCAKLEQQS